MPGTGRDSTAKRFGVEVLRFNALLLLPLGTFAAPVLELFEPVFVVVDMVVDVVVEVEEEEEEEEEESTTTRL